MLTIRWIAMALNALVLLATLFIFLADQRSFGNRETLHYVLVCFFILTPVASLTALWPRQVSVG